MTKTESLFKDHHDLQMFFNSSHIRLHSIHEYFKERGVFIFSSKNDTTAMLASSFFIGIDSQEDIRRYTDVKAFPKISGFLLEPEIETPLKNMQEYLNSHIGEEFNNMHESKLLHVSIEKEKLIVTFEYTISEVFSYNIFDTVKKEASFEVSKIGNIFPITILLNRDTDYIVAKGIIRNLIKDDSDIKLKLIEHDLLKIPTTGKKHEFFKRLIQKLNPIYEVIGIIKYNRNKADDLNPLDSFEDDHLKGSQETKIMDISYLMENLQNRSAFLEGVNIVLHNKKFNHLFVISVISKDEKHRIEVGLASDVKKIDKPDLLEKITDKKNINNFDSFDLSEIEKQDILKDVWNIVSKNYYDYSLQLADPSLVL